MTQTEETQEETEETEVEVGESLPNRVREPDDLPEPYAGDVTWPEVDDVDDMPIAAQYEDAMAALMNQADAAIERIETLYRNGIREIRELVRGS